MSEAVALRETATEVKAPIRAPGAEASQVRPIDYGVNAARGISISLVVLIHAMGRGDERLDVRLPGAGYDQFHSLILYISLQTFIAVSGYLYASRPIRPGSERRFLRSKAKRILVPLFAVTTLLLVTRSIVPGSNQVPDWRDVIDAYVLRFEHLWYLQSLFLVFVAAVILDRFYLLESFRSWAMAVAAAFAAYWVLPVSHIFGYAGLLRLLPYFLIGYGMRRWPNELVRPGVIPLMWVLFIGGKVMQQLDFHGVYDLPDVVVEAGGVLSMFVGTACCFLLLKYRRDIPVFNYFGSINFPIYLYHTIGMAIANRLIGLTPLDGNIHAWFASRLALGFLFPICVDQSFRRVKVLRTVFLGHKS